MCKENIFFRTKAVNWYCNSCGENWSLYSIMYMQKHSLVNRIPKTNRKISERYEETRTLSIRLQELFSLLSREFGM